jgi:hypothetical protein
MIVWMTIELAFGILASSSSPFLVWMQKHGIEMEELNAVMQ